MSKSHHEECLSCSSQEFKSLDSYARHDMVRCKNCGLVFMRRIPSDQELADHYDHYSRRYTISPITVQRYKDLLAKMEPFRKTNRILDVGCGDGNFLAVAKEMNWEIYGVEYTEDAATSAREIGAEMFIGALDASKISVDGFDVVTSFEVLEHIYNPQEHVRHIHELVRPGGLFYFTTPNFNAIERYHLKADYPVINYPEHLIYWTPKTLNALLERTGFKKKKVSTTGINISSFKSRDNKKAQKKIGGVRQSDEELRETIESSGVLKIVKKLVNWILTITGTGNSLKGFYVKPD